jgi:23S rRNA A2030 N6-methylase RlmJ
LLAQSLLRRTVDDHRLVDLYVETVQGLDNFDDNPLNSPFRQIDAYDPATLDFLLPADNKHPVVLIDAAYKDPDDYAQVKALLVRILERNPLATVLVWIPFLEGHRLRWSFATALRDVAKQHAKGGRYYANIVISKHDLQGSAMLVCNPTPLLDDVVDPTTLHWLAHVMNQGKDEYTVEQIMKKKKKQSATS